MCQNQEPKVALVEPHNVGREDAFYTTILFWDCECERDYIHPCTESSCPVCKAEREDSPDARVNELFKYQSDLDLRLMNALTEYCESFYPELVDCNIPF